MIEGAKQIIRQWISEDSKSSVVDARLELRLRAWESAAVPGNSDQFFVAISTLKQKQAFGIVHIRTKIVPEASDIYPHFSLVIPLYTRDVNAQHAFSYMDDMVRVNRLTLGSDVSIAWGKMGLPHGSTRGSFQAQSVGPGGRIGLDLFTTGLVYHPLLVESYAKAADVSMISPQVGHCHIATAYAGAQFFEEDTHLSVTPLERNSFASLITATIDPVATSLDMPMPVAA